jgi:hypothetical protein
MGPVMRDYEIRLHRADGEYSASYFSAFFSDQDALASARLLLSERLPSAAVWTDKGRIGQVYRAASKLPLAS